MQTTERATAAKDHTLSRLPRSRSGAIPGQSTEPREDSSSWQISENKLLRPQVGSVPTLTKVTKVSFMRTAIGVEMCRSWSLRLFISQMISLRVHIPFWHQHMY